MKAFSIAVALIAAAAFCTGLVDTNEYTTTQYVATVGSGEGFDHIASRYYDKDDRKIVFDEFRTEVWNKNANLVKAGRQLQVGDRVIVEVKKIAKK